MANDDDDWGEEEADEEEELSIAEKKALALGGLEKSAANLFGKKNTEETKKAPPIVTQSPEDKATAQANLKAMLEGRGKAPPKADTTATATVTVAPTATILEQNAVIPPPPPPPPLVKQDSQP